MRLLGLLLALPLLASAAPHISEKRGGAFFFKGHDLSSLKQLVDGGSVYKDTTQRNKTRPAEDILGDGGMNTVRLRIWVNPSDGVNGLEYVLAEAKTYYKKGYKIYLDFHFADSWADPQKQPIPAAWPTTLDPLASALRRYVKSTLLSFHKANIDLSLVALGNEIRHGMLWPVGYVDATIASDSARATNFSSLATLYKAARAGVKDAVHHGARKPQVMIHIDNGWDLTLQQNWFGALVAAGVPTSAWDVFGFSFYP